MSDEFEEFEERPRMLDNPLRALVDARQSIQRDRIRFGNRISAIERGSDVVDESTLNILTAWSDRFIKMESDLDNNINTIAEDYPIIQRLAGIRGIGILLASRLVSSIDITRDDTVSSLWRYCGFSTSEGKSERPKKGEKLHYNKSLKPVCYLIGLSFLKTKSPYSTIYYDAKEFYQEHHKDWTKLHIHYASMRKMIKVFLQGLWYNWRVLEGLPVSPPYVIDRMGHTHYKSPEEFGWPPLPPELVAQSEGTTN